MNERRDGLIAGEHEIRDGVVVRCGNQEVGVSPEIEREECLMHRPSCERCPKCKQWIPRLAIQSLAASPSSQEPDR